MKQYFCLLFQKLSLSLLLYLLENGFFVKIFPIGLGFLPFLLQKLVDLLLDF